eukprot:NODE_193_length_2509_cov_15.324797_g146_i0.p1 GENE.NODE_193_length_2509_cov_15.324797_g146_i0~~NODE_193_length_2509_cov_15.324797_g146_i0.p1  ORF type:complete len:803 (-),score=175.94 NODE_193_length_2509_cov_15.324797_g146_i0:100-2292(-)
MPRKRSINLEQAKVAVGIYEEGAQRRPDHTRLFRLLEVGKLLRPDSWPHRLIDLFIAVVMFYHALFIPVRAAFIFQDQRNVPHLAERIGDLLITAIYIAHIVVNFTTATFDERAQSLNHDQKQIAIAYAKSYLVPDVIACLPLDLFLWWGLSGELGVNMWLAFRFLRLCKLVSFSNLFKTSDPIILEGEYVRFYFVFLPLFKLVFWACIWINLLTVFKLLMSDPELVELEALRQNLEWSDASFYGMCFQWVWNILAAGPAEPSIHNVLEFYYSMLLMLVSLLLQGVIIGQLSLKFIKEGIKDHVSSKMRATRDMLAHYKVPRLLQAEVLGFQYHMLVDDSTNADPYGVMRALPVAMREQLNLFMRMRLLDRVPLLAKATPPCRVMLSRKLEQLTMDPQENIVCQGEPGQHMYFLQHGLADVIVSGNVVATLRRGDYFGDHALTNKNSLSSCTVRALSYCDLYRLSASDFEQIASKFAELAELIYNRRADDAKRFGKRNTFKRFRLLHPQGQSAADSAHDRPGEEAIGLSNSVMMEPESFSAQEDEEAPAEEKASDAPGALERQSSGSLSEGPTSPAGEPVPGSSPRAAAPRVAASLPPVNPEIKGPHAQGFFESDRGYTGLAMDVNQIHENSQSENTKRMITAVLGTLDILGRKLHFMEQQMERLSSGAVTVSEDTSAPRDRRRASKVRGFGPSQHAAPAGDSIGLAKPAPRARRTSASQELAEMWLQGM